MKGTVGSFWSTVVGSVLTRLALQDPMASFVAADLETGRCLQVQVRLQRDRARDQWAGQFGDVESEGHGLFKGRLR